MLPPAMKKKKRAASQKNEYLNRVLHAQEAAIPDSRDMLRRIVPSRAVHDPAGRSRFLRIPDWDTNNRLGLFRLCPIYLLGNATPEFAIRPWASHAQSIEWSV